MKNEEGLRRNRSLQKKTMKGFGKLKLTRNDEELR